VTGGSPPIPVAARRHAAARSNRSPSFGEFPANPIRRVIDPAPAGRVGGHGRFKIESAYDLLICGRVCNLAG
jgi:hypothetical protein